jgi:hypothetical protein
VQNLLKLQTHPIGPDLRITSNRNQINAYLQKTDPTQLEDIRYNLYYQLLERAKSDPDFAELFYSLDRAKGFEYETEYVFDIDPDAISSTGYCFKQHKYFYSPTPAKIHFDVYTSHVKIISFYPGYIGAGLSGVGSRLYQCIEDIALNNNCKSIFLNPIAVSREFWKSKGFAPQFDPAMPWVKRLHN